MSNLVDLFLKFKKSGNLLNTLFVYKEGQIYKYKITRTIRLVLFY